MADRLLLNGIDYHIDSNDLPCFISYGEGVGGSHFSVALIADLFLRGNEILFLTAYPMAKDNLFDQVRGHDSDVAHVKSLDDLKINKNKKAIIIDSGNENLFVESLSILDDTTERMVFIKNIETFSGKLLTACSGLKRIILSGDIDQTQIADLRKFKTVIFFSKPKIKLHFNLPELKKYTGYLWSSQKEGLITTNKRENI